MKTRSRFIIASIIFCFALGLGTIPVYGLTVTQTEIMVDDNAITAGQCVTVSVRVTYFHTQAESKNLANPAIPIPINVYLDAWGGDPVVLGPVVHNVMGLGQGYGPFATHVTPWIPIGMIYPLTDGWTDPDYYANADGVESGQVEIEEGATPPLTPGIASLNHHPDIATVSPASVSAGSNCNTLFSRFDAQSTSPIGHSIIGIEQLSFTVPSGWDPPHNTPGVPGFTTVSTTGTIGVPMFSGNQVIVPVSALSASDYIEIVYGAGGGLSGVTAPIATGDYDFGISAVGPLGVQNGFLRVMVQNTPPAIPTLSQWGLVLFTLMLLAVGMVLVQRRRAALRP